MHMELKTMWHACRLSDQLQLNGKCFIQTQSAQHKVFSLVEQQSLST